MSIILQVNRISIPATGRYCLAKLMSSDRTKQICLWITIYIYIYKLADRSRGQPEGFLFYSYYTNVLGRVLLLSLDCSTLPLICTLWCWVLSKRASSNIFFFSFWYDSTWDWSPASRAIEYTNYHAKGSSKRSGWNAGLRYHHEFYLQSRYYFHFHFRTNALYKGLNPLILPSYGLNNTITLLQQAWLWHQVTVGSWHAIK